MGKSKRDYHNLGAEENIDKEVKRISKKKKISVDSEVEEINFNSTKDAKKKSKERIQRLTKTTLECMKEDAKKKKKKRQREDSEVEKKNLSSIKDAKKKRTKKKQREDSEAEESYLKSTEDVRKKRKKKKKQSEHSEAEENYLNSTEDSKKKRKKKRQSEHSEVEVNSLNSTEDAKKKRKMKMKKKTQSEHSEAEENNFNSTKDAKKNRNKKKRQSEDSEAGETNTSSTKDAKKKRKKKRQSEHSEAKVNSLNSTKDAKKKRQDSEAAENILNSTEDAHMEREKKQKCGKNDKYVTTPSGNITKVKFSDQVEVFPAEDEESKEEEGKLVRGKRFTKEENELLKNAVLQYVDDHALGDEGVKMIMKCRLYPQLKGCWKEIVSVLPWRPYESVYCRAHTIFEAGSKGIWTKEDKELVFEYHKQHGNDWRTLADAMGKNYKHVRFAWSTMRLASKNKGSWTREENQNLFDLVNKEIKRKAFQEKYSKHGMLRDNIPWMAVSDQLQTRDHTRCCTKWYKQLTSPLVAKGLWANVDDYKLLDELLKLDAACIDDVDWDNLLDKRNGETCRKRWDQMVKHIGSPISKTFVEQVEILGDRYGPDLAEDRQNFDIRPYDR